MSDIDIPEGPGAPGVGPTNPEAPPKKKKRGGGPRTPEGKAASSRNSLTHGLTAKVLLPEDLAEAVAGRTAELADEFRPATPYESWLVGQMALASARLDRCAELAIADLRRCVDRAILCWDDDRRKAVEDLAARLPKDPSRVAQALGRSRQGVDWLIGRWEGLGEALDANGAWDEGQRGLAFDLLGVAPELRNGSAKVPPEADVEGLAALVARQLDRLRGRLEEALDRLDEEERGMTASGMPLEEDAPTARLRRYEASCRRAYLSARAELLESRDSRPSAGTVERGEAPLSAAPPLSVPASIWMAKRSVESYGLIAPPARKAAVDVPAPRDEARPAATAPAVADAAPPPAPRPVAAKLVVAPPKSTTAFSPPPSGNRRDRRARECLARKSAHRQAVSPGQAAPSR